MANFPKPYCSWPFLPKLLLIFIFILASQMFPLALLLIPIYTYFLRLHLINTYWAVIITHAVMSLPFGIWLAKGFFDTIPREIEEVAAIDGCGRINILLKIVMPLMRPGIVTVVIFTFLYSWREFLYALTLTTDVQARPLGPGIFTYYIGVMTLRWANLMAAAIFAALPVILLYIFLQKYVVSGLTRGAVKG